MEVAILTRDARLLLAAITVAAGLAAMVLRFCRAREGWIVLSAVTAVAAAAVLVVERGVALLATGGAPADAEFNEWRWVLLAPWGRFGMLVGVVAALLALLFAIRGTARERRPWRRATLVGLRAGACLAALVLYLEPALELRHVMREPNHIAVLVDDSRSMALGETRRGPTRAERAAQLLAASAPTFEAWRGSHHVDFYTFSDTVLPATHASLAAGVTPRADATLLREALENVRSRYDGQDLAGIVVISDGIATGRFGEGVDDGASRDFLERLDARVHTAWVGRHGLKDLAIARINYDEFAFVRTVVKVEVVVRGTGFERRELPVTLELDGKAVRQLPVVIGGDTPEARVTFEFTPDRVGKYVYQVSVPVDEDEAMPDNNARAFVLRVIRDKVRVLQVAGRPSWDERALRGLLKSDPNVDLISFFILRTPEDIQLVSPDEMSLIPFPTEELFEHELGSFDVIVFMNFNYGPYQIGPYLENIRKFVEAGGGMAMVGGDLAFSSGGYHGTAVAEALPVELLPATASPDRLISIEEFHPRLTSESRRHPIMQLRHQHRDNEARWNGLPPLEGLNLVAGPKPHATVLAVHPFLKARGGKGMPVIAAGDYGQGRALAILTDSTWRWGFVAAGREGDDGRAYQKFWDNAIRWLIRDPDLEHLHVESDQASYAPGQAPRLGVRLVDKDYRPARGAEIRLQVLRGPSDRPEVVIDRKLRADEGGEAHLDLKPPGPGAYRAVAYASVGDRRLEADDVFLVNAERAELEQPAAREDVLRGIADATGGRYLGEAGKLPPELEFAPPRVVRVDRRRDVELWSRPWIFLLALGFLGGEWALRRRSGYL